MDYPAAEIIRNAEKESAEEALLGKEKLEKSFAEYSEKSRQDFEKFSAALEARGKNEKMRAVKEMEKEISAMQKKRGKELDATESLAKKNMNKAVLSFVRIAGSWKEGA